MISIDIRVVGLDEAILHLEEIPRKIRSALAAKYEELFVTLREEFTQGLPGKYIGAERIHSGTQMLGSAVVGFIEVEEKPGVYAILPSKAKALRFLTRSGETVYARAVMNHPFPKGGEPLRRFILRQKPWLIDQIEDAVIEAL